MSYRLVIHDDAVHTFDYVIDIFVRVLGVGHKEAFELASKIHEDGEASVNFYELTHVREAEERLLSGGPDTAIPGSEASLAVSVEQVDGATTKVLSRGRVGPRGYEPLGEEQLFELHGASRAIYGEVDLARVVSAGRTGAPCVFPPGVLAMLGVIALLFAAMFATR